MTTVYGDLVRYRELFGNLFRRDVQAKYRGSILGVAWTLANPVLLMAVYLLVFSVLWKTQFGSEGHYALFLLGGLRDPLFYGRLPGLGDTLYTVVAALVALALGGFVFNRVDDQIAVEV